MVNTPAIHLETLGREVHRSIAGAVGGEEAVDLIALMLPLQDDPSCVLLYTSTNKYKTAFLPLVAARESLLHRLEEPPGTRLAGDHTLGEWVALEDSAGWVRGAEASGPAITSFARHEAAQWAGFYLRMNDRGRIPDAGILSRLDEIAQDFAEQAGPVIDTELLRHRLETLQAMQAGMLRPLVAPDKATLIADLAEVVDGFFGFSRVYLALYHPASRAFRAESPRGFQAGSTAFSISAASENLAEACLARAVEAGRVRLYPRDGENAPEVEAIVGREPADGETRRAILAPLKIGERPLGFVYADTPRSKGIFLCASAIEGFAGLAAAALENVLLREGAEERAQLDPVTGLYNRRYLERLLKIEGTRIQRYNNPVSAIMLDICFFRRANETLGHAFGDQLLREAGALIQKSVRAPDAVVRFGGDEFVVLLSNTGAEHAEIVARRIEAAFESHNARLASERMRLRVCMGVSTADARTFGGLIEDADRRLSERKLDLEKRLIIEALLGAPNSRGDAIDNVIASLLTSLRKREAYFQTHSRRVAYICLALCKELRLEPAQVRTILLAALLHDVGKVSLPGEILRRPGPLDPEEIEAVRSHPIVGEEFFRGLAYMEESRPIIRHHHERYDGAMTGEFAGYPEGLRGDAIPIGARVLKLADSVDAMLSDRPYQQGRPVSEVVRIIREESGASFDPRLVELLTASGCLDQIDSPEALLALYASTCAEPARPAQDAV